MVRQPPFRESSHWSARLACACLLAVATSVSATDHTQDVDPFIDVDGDGEMFLGATVPFGMVKFGPDLHTYDGKLIKSGYHGTGEVGASAICT